MMFFNGSLKFAQLFESTAVSLYTKLEKKSTSRKMYSTRMSRKEYHTACKQISFSIFSMQKKKT